jgi:hypothetical protein
MEPFALKIRSDPDIVGLKLPTSLDECRISQYADDPTLIVTNYASIDKIFKVAQLYCLASGAKINKQKSYGLWLGAWKNNPMSPANLSWSSGFNKYYGVYIGNGDYVSHNFNGIYNKFCKSIDNLKTRNLPMVIKPKVINLFSCSKIWYAHAVLPRVPRSLNKYTSYMFQYLWNNSTDRIRRSIIYKDFADGGLRLINVEGKIKAFHIRHILNFLFGEYAKWHSFMEYWAGIQLRDYKPTLKTNIVPHNLEGIPLFYKQCLNLFKDYFNDPTSYPTGLEPIKNIYWNLINKDFTTARIITKNPSIDFKSAWKLIHSVINHPVQREISWKISHDIMPINYKLFKFHIARSAECPMCTNIETNAHRFVSCCTNRLLWKEVISMVVRINGKNIVLDKK